MADTESKTFSSMTNEEQLAEVNNAIYAVL